MTKRQVLILWIIAVVLGVAVATVRIGQRQSTDSATKRSPGDTLFESFPAEQVATIDIQGAGSSTTLTRKDETWVVANRDDFPANNTFVNSLLRTLADLKVTQGMEAGPSFAPRFGMDPDSSDPETRGITATFKDSAGEQLAAVSVGKNIESAASSSPMGGGSVGRFIRNHADESGFYAVSEMFPSLSAEPQRWLSQDFISPEKIKTISVTQPGSDEVAWQVTREDENGEFSLANGAPGEVLDSTATSPLKSLLSYARFEDVIPAAQVEERIIVDKIATAVIQTFDGFTYALTIAPTKPTGEPESDEQEGPPAGDTLALTVNVTADLPTGRKKEEGESEEEAKTKDAAFGDRLKTLADKLKKESTLNGRTFEVSQSTFEPILKEREDLLQKDEPAAAAPQPGIGSPMILPGANGNNSVTTPPIQAFTPPIAIPPADEDPIEQSSEESVPEETEVETTPSDDAEPVEGEEPEVSEE